MNKPFSQQTNFQDSFASNGISSAMPSTSTTQQVSDNPFTGDLKGEFTSNFGTNTNAVSQLFKDGSYAPSSNKKFIIIGAIIAILLIIIGIYYYQQQNQLNDLGLEDDFPSATVATNQEQSTPPTGAQSTVEPQKDVGIPSQLPGDQTQIQSQQSSSESPNTVADSELQTELQTNSVSQPINQEATQVKTNYNGSISLIMPAPDDSITYDETKGPAVFRWEGPAGGYIVFSRNPNFQPETMRIAVKGNSYRFRNPYPGNWYWRVENAEGVSEVRKFTVLPPVRRNIVFKEPVAGGEVQGNGGIIAWQGDTKVAFYRVELSTNNNWTNPTYRFATSGERIELQNVAAGNYQLRIGAFSEVSGRWEYTVPINVTVR